MSDYTYDTGASHYVFDQTSARSAPSGPELDNFEVDTESLANAAQTLDRLADFVEQTMLVDMKLNLDLGAAAGGSGSSKGEIVFGRFEASSEVAAKQRGHFQAALQSTNALITSLRSTADGTRDIAEKYKNVEQANKDSVKAIEGILASGDGGYPASGSTPTSYGSESVPASYSTNYSSGSSTDSGQSEEVGY